MSSEEQEQWKNRWLPKGLPETLLDEMIAEANAEYESELEYSPYNRYNTLGVIINDLDPTENCFYLITVQRGDEVFQGHALLESEYLFTQIPTVEVVISVYKMLYTSILETLAFGYSIFSHTKDESVTIDVNTISPPPEPNFTISDGGFEDWQLTAGTMPDLVHGGAFEGNNWIRQHYSAGFYWEFTLYHAIDNLDSNLVDSLLAYFYRQYSLTGIWFMQIIYSDSTYTEEIIDLDAGWARQSVHPLPNKIITGIKIGTAQADTIPAGFDNVSWELP